VLPCFPCRSPRPCARTTRQRRGGPAEDSHIWLLEREDAADRSLVWCVTFPAWASAFRSLFSRDGPSSGSSGTEPNACDRKRSTDLPAGGEGAGEDTSGVAIAYARYRVISSRPATSGAAPLLAEEALLSAATRRASLWDGFGNLRSVDCPAERGEHATRESEMAGNARRERRRGPTGPRGGHGGHGGWRGWPLPGSLARQGWRKRLGGVHLGACE